MKQTRVFWSPMPSIVRQMKTPLILPMDSSLMPRSRVRVDIDQTHRFPRQMPGIFF